MSYNLENVFLDVLIRVFWITGDPDEYVTRDGTWAAIPWAGKKKGFAIIHNGRQVHSVTTYKQALAYIKKQSKIKTTSTLEEFL